MQAGQQQLLREVDDALRAEYTVRRRMLIERIKVCVGVCVGWCSWHTDRHLQASLSSLTNAMPACSAPHTPCTACTYAHTRPCVRCGPSLRAGHAAVVPVVAARG
jgi:hypothetical protein